MLQLRLLGALCLTDDGTDVAAVLHQPKRAALLGYLAAAHPRGFHRRDALLARFWPDLDTRHARDALNSALKFLRDHAGAGVVVSRGPDEVGVDPAALWCDVAAFDDALAQQDYTTALGLYRGDLLESFHASEAEGFAEWLESERRRLRDAALRAACELCRLECERQRPGAALHWAKWAADLAPDDESVQRRLIEMLDRTGDRAGALRTYETLAARLASEFGVPPAPETEALIRSARTRAGSLSAATGAEPSSSQPAAARRRPRWVGWAAALVLVTAAPAAVILLRRPALPAARVAVVSLETVGDSAARWLGLLAADRLAAELGAVRFVEAVELGSLERPSGAMPMSTHERVIAAARGAGAGTVVWGVVTAVGDSLAVTGHIIDVNTGVTLASLPAVVVPAARAAEGAGVFAERATRQLRALLEPGAR